MWENGEFPAELANHPVVWVSWHDATAFAHWAGLELPPEQQWEKAARGKDGQDLPWGVKWKPYCNTRETNIGTTTPVGYYSPFGDSPYGCVDMSGNVWEWTVSSLDKDPTRMILCGGSWISMARDAVVTHRIRLRPHYLNRIIGFRVISRFSL